jgi:outer membrane receptor protein involved in Fe transport
MARNTNVRNAIKLALAVNAGLLGLSAAPGALAQEEGAGQLEEITVTGSRIKKKDFTSNAPVATIGFEQIELTGTVNTESLLNTLPQTVPGLDRTSNNPGNGTATVDLRGLGSNRTLVLINGTRVNPTTSFGTVDINSIPNSLIQNIEVLTGGASAVYGSDAISGVVNFILKDNFEGVNINAGFEQSFEGDAGLYSTDFTIGANVADGRGNVVLNMAYTDREALFQGDRDFSFTALTDNADATALNPGGSTGVPQTSIFNGGLGNFAPNTSGIIFDGNGDVREFVTEGSVNDYYNYAPVNYIQLPQKRYQGTALGHFDISDRATAYGRFMYTSSIVPQELAPTPAFVTSTFTLDGSPFISDAAQVILSGDDLTRVVSPDGDGTWSATSNVGIGTRLTRAFDGLDAEGEPATGFQPYLNPDDPTDPTWVPNQCTTCNHDTSFVDVMTGTAGSITDPQPDGIDDDPRLDTTLLIDADANGIADNARALVRRRLKEVGPRTANSNFTTYQVQAGLKGDLSDSWSYDGYVQVGSVVNSGGQLGNINTGRFQQALLLNLDDQAGGDPNGTVCANTANSGSTVGCAPVNIFGEGNVSQAGADFIKVAVAASASFDQTIYGANFTGDLGGLELPGGEIGVAVGFERIENSFDFSPSQDLAAGTIAGFNGSPPVNGGYTVESFYGEVYLPILSGAPMADLLDLELAYRTSDYSTSGSVEAYKIGASWAPIPSFRIRGGFNHAVRAPSIGELFSPQGENFPGATDPCSADGAPDAATAAICVATGLSAGLVGSSAINLASSQVRSISGGNPNLKPEEADTYTVGFVVQPAALEGLSLSLDYFNIEILDYITSFGGGAANVLNTCYDATNPNGGAGSAFCNVITRRGDGTIDNVNLLIDNVASQTMVGYDLLGSYDFDMFGGDARLSYVGTFTEESLFTAFEGDPAPIEAAGHYGQLVGEPVPEYSHRATFRWSGDRITGQLLWRHVGEVTDDDPGSVYTVETIKGYDTFDLSGTFRFNDNYWVTAGIDNVADTTPPLLGDNQEQANTYPATYDVFGRTFFIRATADF